jgi:hypothetical protein
LKKTENRPSSSRATQAASLVSPEIDLGTAMHLLHRSSVFGGGGGRAPRRGVGSSPRAPPPRQHQIFSKSESIKKRSGGGGKGSKRARLRAGLAAALQELRLGGRHKRGSPLSAAARATQPSSNQVAQVACRGADAAAGTPCGPTAFGSPDWTTTAASGGGGPLLLLLALLALVCVVALGRAPAVCCCTCAAWWCRGRSAAAATTGRRQAAPPSQRRALK